MGVDVGVPKNMSHNISISGNGKIDPYNRGDVVQEIWLCGFLLLVIWSLRKHKLKPKSLKEIVYRKNENIDQNYNDV